MPPPSPAPRIHQAPGLRLRHWPGWAEDSHLQLQRLAAQVPWKQERITLFGRTHPLPRLTCWVGDPGCHYTYSGLASAIEPWTPLLQGLRQRVEAAVGCRFNSLLLNRYRDGRDRMHWHADDEPELDPRHPIASLSFGASRSFRLRPRHPARTPADVVDLDLGDGDLLVMDPPTQRHWLHQVPARLRVKQERINLTFRWVRSR